MNLVVFTGVLFVAGFCQVQVTSADGTPYLWNSSYITAEGVPTEISPPLGYYSYSGPVLFDPSSVAIVTEPSNGILNIDEVTGCMWYDPAPGVYGNDSFTYSISDINGNVSNVATVTIRVTPAFPPPRITDLSIASQGGGEFMISGQVVNLDPNGTMVYFGGLLEGCFMRALPDGTFLCNVTLSPGTSGELTVEAINEDGMGSEIVDEWIYN